MNPGEILSMVTARAVPLEHFASGHGRLTRDDIQHALGMVNHNGATLLIRVKFCHQTELLSDLDLYFWQAVIDKALSFEWPYPRKMEGKEFFRNMGRLALSENIQPGICLECGGTGKQIADSKLIDCHECGGSGKSRKSDRSRARLLGMPWQTWNNTWQDRYSQIQGLAEMWEGIGLGGMVKRLKSA